MSNQFHAGPEDVSVDDAVDVDATEEERQKLAQLDPHHLGHGVHARGDRSPVAGVHVDDAALPSPNHTGAGLGGMQIGDSRF